MIACTDPWARHLVFSLLAALAVSPAVVAGGLPLSCEAAAARFCPDLSAQAGAECGGNPATVGPPLQGCEEDYRRLCANAEHATGVDCLYENLLKLSGECAASVEILVERRNFLKNLPACKKDARRHCPDLSLGALGVIKCLREHMENLQPGCRSGLKVLRPGKAIKPLPPLRMARLNRVRINREIVLAQRR
jgi:hypothetical protein